MLDRCWNRCLLVACIVAVLLAESSVFGGYSIRAIDEHGNPIPKFEAMVDTADNWKAPWIVGSEGIAELSPVKDATVIDVIVRADGYASSVQRFAGEERKKLERGEAVIVLRRGTSVQLKFRLPEETKWPTGLLPQTYFAEYESHVRWTREPDKQQSADRNMLNATAIDTGVFSLQLSKEAPPFAIAIHAPGFLQYFEAGIFRAADVKDGRLEIELPRPAAIDVGFDFGEFDREKLPFSAVTFHIWRYMRPVSRDFNVAGTLANAPLDETLSVADLSPGDYAIRLHTIPKPGVQKLPGTDINPGEYHDLVGVTLKDGQRKKVTLSYSPFDKKAFRGDRTAVLHFVNPDGTPVVADDMTVNYFDVHHGPVPIFSGPIPKSGDVVIRGLTDRKRQIDRHTEPYQVKIGKKLLGGFRFSSTERSERFEFHLEPGVGDIAPDIELIDATTGKMVRLHDLRGKLVVLDFWATWCIPCQPALNRLDQLVAENASEWKDHVRIMPVSIDESIKSIGPHFRHRGWTNLTSYWSGESDRTGWKSPAARRYAIVGVPTMILIGRNGKILWRAHGRTKDGEPDIEDRIKAVLQEVPKVNRGTSNAEGR